MSRNICIFDIFRPTGPIWPLFDGFDPSLTSDDPNWPWKILNLNSWENFESKHMYIGYISTNPPDLTLIRRFDPSLTSGDQVMINTDSGTVKNFQSFKVFVIKIDRLDGALEQFSSFCSYRDAKMLLKFAKDHKQITSKSFQDRNRASIAKMLSAWSFLWAPGKGLWGRR